MICGGRGIRTSTCSEHPYTTMEKSGWLHVRNKRKSWKKQWVVLRAEALSVYKDEREYEPVRVIPAEEISSVALLDDLNFAVFTSSINHHFKSDSRTDSESWVAQLKEVGKRAAEGVVDAQKRERALSAKGVEIPIVVDTCFSPHSQLHSYSNHPHSPHMDGAHSHTEYSGDDVFSSQSEWDDDRSPLSKSPIGEIHPFHDPVKVPKISTNSPPQSSGPSPTSPSPPSPSRSSLIAEGPLLRLKKRYNQWQRQYAVLTPEALSFYKSASSAHEHKKPIKTIPVAQLLDVVELDPLSKSKSFCMQLITPAKRIRFSLDSETELTKWLVAIKSIASEDFTKGECKDAHP
ncbi:putative PH domain-containing protein [Yarrowia sp. B02]|nr:putative PH domain-containing protein [Yarrowia sp. B02]